MSRPKDTNAHIVYSTEHGALCHQCQKPVRQCMCRQKKTPGGADGIVRVGRQTKGRKGKGVTTITGVPLPENELKALAKKIKTGCGSGGAIRDGVIEIQGDHRARLVEELKKYGWTVKLSGG